MSLYTPQIGEVSPERLTAEDRRRVVDDLLRLRGSHPKLDMTRGMLETYIAPPASPEECIFAKTTTCFSADLERRITPCQYGGAPDCTNCGCIASAGLAALGRHQLGGAVRVGALFDASLRVGSAMRRVRGAGRREVPVTQAG
jgi:hypothetical protein